MARNSSAPLAAGRWIPALGWLRNYDRGWLRPDLIAGVTLAAYMLPAALGDASLANLPPEAGLYACLFGGLVFWLFCSSRQTVVTVTSAISLLIGASLGDISGGDPSRFGALAAGTALLVALIAFLAWLARAGAIVAFISESVMTGFKCGVALFLASTQLPKLFGIPGAHGDFFENAGAFFAHLGATNAVALAVGGVALAILVLGKVYLPNKPVALFVVVGGILLSAGLDLEAAGVKLLGAVPEGLPPIGFPSITFRDLNELLPLALACFLLGAVETAAIGRMFAAKHDARLDANQEFLALAASNLLAGLGRGFPVSGGMSQSLVNEGGGARTPLSGFIAALIILVVVLFLSQLLRSLPQPVLAAVVLVAVAGLFKLSALKSLWREDRSEFLVAMMTVAGVLTSGLLRGVLIGAVISLVQLLRQAAAPHVADLGRYPGTERFGDLAAHPDNVGVAGVAILRPEGSLLYFNIEGVRDAVLDRVDRDRGGTRLVVLDLSASPVIDMHAAAVLVDLAEELKARGVRFKVVEARAAVRRRLARTGADAEFGGVDHLETVAGVVAAYEARGGGA